MTQNPTFLMRSYRGTSLSLATAAALLFAEGCLPAQDAQDVQGNDTASANSLAQAAAALRSDPNMAVAIKSGSDHLMGLRASLGLNADHGFVARSATVDEFGKTHLRFDQTYRGVRIWEGEGIVELSAQNAAQAAIHTLQAVDNVAVAPALNAAKILKIAHSELRPKGAYASDPSAELVIYPESREQPRANLLRGASGELNAQDMERVVDRYTLAYHVHTEVENGADDTRHTDYLINAQNGAILKKWSTLFTAAEIGSGLSQYSGTIELNTNGLTGSYELRDVKNTMNITTYNLNHATSGTGTVFTVTDNKWGDGKNYVAGSSTTAPNGVTAGVDAHYGVGETAEYYANVHMRNGIDGLGKATYNRVHYSNKYDNAFWSDTCFCMTYGDGSAFTVLTSIDVTGHEMTHGVTARTSNLTYSGESGGLNEAHSDIHGTMVEFYSRSGGGPTVGETGGNWLIGEQLSTTPLRYMIKPSKDGTSPNAWSATVKNLDVHYSSGPMNRAFYFLSKGSSKVTTDDAYSSYLPSGMTGIGNDKAARISFRALTVKMTSSTNYAAARTAYLAAATDLYGATGDEYAAVENAFAGINVGLPHGSMTDTTPPTAALTAPAGGATVTGSVTVSANATDNIAVTKVEFYAGTNLIGTDTTSPYSIAWDSTTAANGSYALTAKAYDAASNFAISTAVNVTVSNMGGGTCTSASQLLANPDFEGGAVSWTTTAGVIDNSDPANAHGGTWEAWLNGYGKTRTDTMYQEVTIPATACSAKLSFWLLINTAETGTTVYDKLVVSVQDTTGKVLGNLGTYSNVNAGPAYVQRTFDLAAYKGKTIRINFKGTEDSTAQTSFLIDDAAVNIVK